jgi:hypothetical protein
VRRGSDPGAPAERTSPFFRMSELARHSRPGTGRNRDRYRKRQTMRRFSFAVAHVSATATLGRTCSGPPRKGRAQTGNHDIRCSVPSRNTQGVRKCHTRRHDSVGWTCSASMKGSNDPDPPLSVVEKEQPRVQGRVCTKGHEDRIDCEAGRLRPFCQGNGSSTTRGVAWPLS